MKMKDEMKMLTLCHNSALQMNAFTGSGTGIALRYAVVKPAGTKG